MAHAGRRGGRALRVEVKALARLLLGGGLLLAPAVREGDATNKGFALWFRRVRVDVASSTENVHDRVVDLVVGLMALDVLVTILEHGDRQHDDEGQDDQTGRDSRELGEELQDGDEQEEDVGDSSELLEQVAGDECDDGVLGSDVLVGAERLVLEDAALLVIVVVWERLVDEDCSRVAGPTFLGEPVPWVHLSHRLGNVAVIL